MKPFFVTIAYNLHLTILPETEVRLDGHPILTYTYSIFRREASKMGIAPEEINISPLKNKEVNPYYLGHVNYEEPGTVFNYIADGEDALTRKEVEEVIDEINRYRDTPELWEI